MKRPAGVTVVAVLQLAAAAISIVVSFSLLVPGTALDRMWQLNPGVHAAFADHAVQVAPILALVGLLTAICGVGLLRGYSWAWLLSVALFGTNALGDMVSLLMVRDWFRGIAGIVIDAALLYQLLHASTREFFLRRR
ncbi:MAG TPA: hypothetical protein VHZ25_08960 [Acidobacteriaceae bacterium]|jgi:hypothetical protein|nr:hypothetical protein [Acidobacteriaceae bacterium]